MATQRQAKTDDTLWVSLGANVLQGLDRLWQGSKIDDLSNALARWQDHSAAQDETIAQQNGIIFEQSGKLMHKDILIGEKDAEIGRLKAKVADLERRLPPSSDKT